MRTLLWFLHFWLLLLFLIPAQRRACRLEREGKTRERDELVDRYVAWWAGRMTWAAGVTVELRGREHIPADTPCVFIGNHQGYFDIPILLAGLDRPHAFMAKKETAGIPLIRGWMKLLGCVFLDRTNTRSGIESIRQSVELLEGGRSLILFPEGTRSKGGPVGEFKPGAAKIACRAGVPVVPVRISGSHLAMEANRNWIRPAHVVVEILPAIPTADMSREEQKDLNSRLRGLYD